MYDAVFFDLDGTLIDTERLAFKANREVFDAIGHQVDDAFLHSLIGKDIPTLNRLLQEMLPDHDLVQLETDFQAAFLREMEEGLLLKPGARALLDGLSLPAALVTSSQRKGAHHKMDLTGIREAFVEIITVEDVTQPKPAPAPYLLAAERLGVSPARCLVFEDSEIGAEAAHRAGCVVVQIEDVLAPSGRWAHHIAPDLLSGARLAGL